MIGIIGYCHFLSENPKGKMDDPTDTALAACTGVGLALCCLAAFWTAYRRVPLDRIKVSRSDPDLENLQDLVADSIPSHK